MSFWATCFKSDNELLSLCAKLSMISSSTVADNLREVLASMEWGYEHLLLFVHEGKPWRHAIQDTFSISDKATAGLIKELCLQRDGCLEGILMPQEISELLTWICTV